METIFKVGFRAIYSYDEGEDTLDGSFQEHQCMSIICRLVFIDET